MAGRFVRSSKYRHVFGRSARKEQCYDNLRISTNAWDTNLVKVNPQYLSVNWETAGGGAFAVIPLSETGKLPERFPLFRGHTAVVLDTDWNPFNDSLITSSSEDGKIFLWRVPDGFTLHSDADSVSDIAPVGKLSGHPRKVGHVLFNPAAENVLASASGDFSVKIWDIETGSSKLTLKLGDVVQSLSWSANGSLLVTTSRDKKLRLWDVRQERAIHESQSHSGAKNSRAVWMGEHDRIATTGFSRMSDRQMALWDVRAPREPINGFRVLDSISGVCIPHWDDGTQCLYLAGKGDGNIRYFEYENDKFEYLSEYKSGDPQRGVGFMPKRGVNMHDNEVVRAFKTVNDTYIEPISFIVPRRAEVFQDDIYPPTTGLKAAVSSSDWFVGKDGLPPKIDMASLYEGEGLKEISPDASSTPRPTPVTSTVTTEPQKPAVKVTETLQEAAPQTHPVIMAANQGTMKEQTASMAAMVSKYADASDRTDDADEKYSFEEIPKLEEPHPSISVSHAEPETVSSPPGLWRAKSSDIKKVPSIEKTPENIPNLPVVTPGVETPTLDDFPTNSQSSILREMEKIKTLIADQTKAIAAQAKQITILTSEIDDLKQKLG
ncbi:Coronin-like protein crn1 [Ophidiomyces ophidiicola]|nr:Coronin-like protein crn1 [Ophidiomyces ophidiicola]KAI2152029.1 Coronin-like protein crn1 [Ophidiomyces ophidiicola]KAI2157878.1 Coronin-like protein crn1 [Ophidiomyces ophidiicola]KAI2270800.1 Coronin-like protein crn1 [Ophidiomyces ophidiicola]KAI2348692.1 Coronin-like protein crn1 [Ophidiomyces ophidiicola]